MKIGYLCSDVEIEVFGHHGCSVHIREFTNALVEAGHEVFIACARAGDGSRATTRAPVHEIGPDGLDALASNLIAREPLIREHHLERDLWSVLWNSWLQRQGAALIERERPDVLYERYCLLGWGGVELSRRYGIPLILEVNAPDSVYQIGYENFTLTETARVMEGTILRRADAVVALSRWLADWARGLGVEPRRIRVIPDGVTERLFAGMTSGAEVRRRHGLTGHRTVGFVGSFQPWHDLKGLVQAFARLHADDAALRLLLVGDGEKRKALETTVRALDLSSAVVFTGKVPHEDVPEHVAAMDVAVIPYPPLDDFYFSPLKLFECMAAGRPTVAAALGQVAEVVEHGRTGWLYPAGDVEKLAAGILTLLGRPELSAGMWRAARETVLSRYTWRAVTEEVVEIARGLITERRGPGTA
jgi:glycosyltransferase involved in cell wall biosynthesis